MKIVYRIYHRDSEGHLFFKKNETGLPIYYPYGYDSVKEALSFVEEGDRRVVILPTVEEELHEN